MDCEDSVIYAKYIMDIMVSTGMHLATNCRIINDQSTIYGLSMYENINTLSKKLTITHPTFSWMHIWYFSLNYTSVWSKVSNHYMTALVQVKAWLRIGTKVSLEQMMPTSQMHLWVNNHKIIVLWFKMLNNGNFQCKFITFDQHGDVIILLVCLGEIRLQKWFTKVFYISTATLSIT